MTQLITGINFKEDIVNWDLDTRPIILIGESGSGKTSFIKSYHQSYGIDNNRVGVLVPVNSINHGYKQEEGYNIINENDYNRLSDKILGAHVYGSPLSPESIKLKKLLHPELENYQSLVLDDISYHYIVKLKINGFRNFLINTKATLCVSGQLGIRSIWSCDSDVSNILNNFHRDRFHLVLLRNNDEFFNKDLLYLAGIDVPKNLRPRKQGQYVLVKAV